MEIPRIVLFEPWMQEDVVEHILAVENGDLGLDLSLDDQPDLVDIERSYVESGGSFWVAFAQDELVGTLGLFDLGGGDGDLRKMFVKKEYRGGQPSLAQRMLNELLDWSRRAGFRRIFLETNNSFVAAIHLYERNGFTQVDRSQLPATFPVIRVAERFHVKVL